MTVGIEDGTHQEASNAKQQHTYVVGHLKKSIQEGESTCRTCQWRGERIEVPERKFSYLCCHKTVEPYANSAVYKWWDIFKTTVFMLKFVWLNVGLHLGKAGLISPIPSVSVYSFDGGGSSSVWAWLTVIIDAITQVEVIGMLLQAYSLKTQKTSLQYRFWAWLHCKYHSNNPPFIPTDNRGNTVQILDLWFHAVSWIIFKWILVASVSLTDGERVVLEASMTLYLGLYMGIQSIYCLCGYKSYVTLAMANGWLTPMPQKWNGLEVDTITYAVHGPQFEFSKNGQLILGRTWNWSRVNKELGVRSNKDQALDTFWVICPMLCPIIAGEWASGMAWGISGACVGIWIFTMVGIELQVLSRLTNGAEKYRDRVLAEDPDPEPASIEQPALFEEEALFEEDKGYVIVDV